MLGISIYPEKSNKEDIIKYLKLAAKYNFKRVFTCLLSVEETKEKIKSDFTEIITTATKLGMEVILDIAPNVFEKLGISYSDLAFFKELGATGIRLDLGFDGKTEAEMTYNKYDLDIEVNMSMGTTYLETILSYQANRKKLIGCHNFYPMEFSGISLEHFIDTSLQYRDQNLRSAAFVSSQDASYGPWPVMDGLCTLEMHRKLPITTQVKHHKMLGLVDDIIIANMFASEAELKAISEIGEIPEFKVELFNDVTDIENKIIFDESHLNRGDVSEYLIRSTMSRIKYKDAIIKPHSLKELIDKGDICIANENFSHYKGELHLTLSEHPNTMNRKNIVGKIIDEEIFLLDYLKPWSMFKFTK